MRILFVSGELIGSAICHELLREGHEVKLYIERAGWKECLTGIVPKTEDWRAELSWVGTDGLIIFDDVCFGKDQEELRSLGYRVVGGSVLADELETNRSYFHDVLEEHGVKTLQSLDFDSATAAIEHIKANPAEWVVKQNSHYGALNYVGETADGSDAIAVLETYQVHDMTAHLQRKAKGVEIGVARYFNGNDWVGPIEINHEHKRMCNGDIGPLTPEMGTVMWFSDDDELPLFERTLARLKPFLQKANFKGDFDINCIVTERDIWPLEATARFGAPSTELQSEMLVSPWLEFLNSLADGTPLEPQFAEGYGVVVSIAVPPYPYTKSAVSDSVFTNEVLQVFFKETLSDDDRRHIYFEEISLRPADDTGRPEAFFWAGTNGWTMHVTGQGPDIESARRRAYAIVEKIVLPKMFYRTDIGERVMHYDLPRLRSWGWV